MFNATTLQRLCYLMLSNQIPVAFLEPSAYNCLRNGNWNGWVGPVSTFT